MEGLECQGEDFETSLTLRRYSKGLNESMTADVVQKDESGDGMQNGLEWCLVARQVEETTELTQSVMKVGTCGNGNISHPRQDLGIVVFLCSKAQALTDNSDKMRTGRQSNSCCIKNKLTLYSPLKY